MPTEWDSFAPQAPQGAPQQNNEDFNSLIGGADASNLAPADVVEGRRRRRINWRGRSVGQKLMGAAGSVVNNVPIVGESLAPSNTESIQEFRENSPLLSLGTNVVGSGLPLAGQAARVAQPAFRAAFGTFPRAVGTSAAVGGLDAASRGGNPAVGAGLAGLTAGILSGVGKGITPRTDARRFEINRQAAADRFSQTRQELEAASGRRKVPATNVDSLPESARNRIQEAGQPPVPQLPEFGDLPWYLQSGFGGVGTYMLSRGHPLATLIGGVAAPMVTRGARHGAERINRALASPRGRRYMNNRVLNDRMRTMLNSAGIALTPDELTRNSNVSNQQIMDFLGDGAQ